MKLQNLNNNDNEYINKTLHMTQQIITQFNCPTILKLSNIYAVLVIYTFNWLLLLQLVPYRATIKVTWDHVEREGILKFTWESKKKH